MHLSNLLTLLPATAWQCLGIINIGLVSRWSVQYGFQYLAFRCRSWPIAQKVRDKMEPLWTWFMPLWLLPYAGQWLSLDMTNRWLMALFTGLHHVQTVLLFAIWYQLINVIQWWISERFSQNGMEQWLPLLSFVNVVTKGVLAWMGLALLPIWLKKYKWLASVLEKVSFGTLGITTIIGFASQHMLKNVFGTFAILMDKSFVVGDHISIGHVKGVVESIGLRTVKIRSKSGTLFHVPSGLFAEQVVENVKNKELKADSD